MARTYKQGIEDLIGTTTPAVDDDVYTQHLLDSAQELVNLVPKDVLWSIATEVSLSSGGVSSTTITAPGSGYTSTPTITFSDPTNANGTTATGTAILDTEALSSITITNAGKGYTTAPTITVTGGDGSGATATSTLSNDYVALSNNAVLYVTRETESNVIDSNADGTDDTTMEVECRKIAPAIKGRITPGSGYVEECTENDPVYFLETGKVFILPKPSMTAKVVYASVDDTLAFDDDIGDKVTLEMGYIIVLHSAMKSLVVHINNLDFPEFTSSSFTSDTLTTLVNGPDFTNVNSNFAIALADYPTIADNFLIDAGGEYVDFTSTPTYTTPTTGYDIEEEIETLKTHIEEEDVELAGLQASKIQQIMADIQRYQHDANLVFQSTFQDAQNKLQEAINEAQIEQGAKEKEKSLQLAVVKGKLERRMTAIDEVMKQHQGNVSVMQGLINEYQSKLQSHDARKKQKQELQISIQNSYNGSVQALLSKYKTETREVGNPQITQEMLQNARGNQ